MHAWQVGAALLRTRRLVLLLAASAMFSTIAGNVRAMAVFIHWITAGCYSRVTIAIIDNTVAIVIFAVVADFTGINPHISG